MTNDCYVECVHRSIAFKQKTYTALVSFTSQGYDLSYLVRYLDDIKALIPANKLVVSLSGGVGYSKLVNGLAQDFIYETTVTCSHMKTNYLNHPRLSSAIAVLLYYHGWLQNCIS